MLIAWSEIYYSLESIFTKAEVVKLTPAMDKVERAASITHARTICTSQA